MKKLNFEVYWSDEDECYVCQCIEFDSVMTHGNTVGEALFEMSETIDDVIDDMGNSSDDEA